MSEHPCDGAWLVLDDLWRACRTEAVGPGLEVAAGWGLTGIMAGQECLLALGAELPDSLGVMEVHGRGPVEPGTLSERADLWAVAPTRETDEGTPQDRSGASVLDLRGEGPALHPGPWMGGFQGAHGEPMAVLLPRADEDALEALSRFEDIAVFVPGDEFASGYRLGAGSHYGLLAALHPGAAARALELAEKEVTLALDVERRLQRFLEADIAPRMRRLGLAPVERNGLLLEVLGWIAISEPRLGNPEAEALGASLRQGIPELFDGA